jgi:hypothetical protein
MVRPLSISVLNNGGFLARRNDAGVQMSQKSLTVKPSSEKVVEDIRRATRKYFRRRIRYALCWTGCVRAQHC